MLDDNYEQVTYLDSAFWTFIDNEIYRVLPNHERELVFSLTPGAVINKIGSSDRHIWLTDDTYFYTYNVDTRDFQSRSLMELYQSSESSQTFINDAQYVLSNWVVATNSGTYITDGTGFNHVANSGKFFIEMAYFSKQRREVVIGTLNGALIIDITNPNSTLKHVGSSHVLTVTETEQAYWIGTEDGLFVYSFVDGTTRKYTEGGLHDFELAGNKIYSLVNDQAGGIWIASNKGIQYFSIFGQKFERLSSRLLTYDKQLEKPVLMRKSSGRDGYWLITSLGLYRVSLQGQTKRDLIFKGNVNDIAEFGNLLLVATEEGLICIDIVTNEVVIDKLPESLKNIEIDFVEVDTDGVIWTVTNDQLSSFNPESNEYKDYSNQWIISAHLPAKVTDIKASSEKGLFLGTDHGLYSIRNGHVRFFKQSERIGQVTHIEESQNLDVWVASTYGVFRILDDVETISQVTLAESNIIPQCVISTSDGVWLTTSSGLSYYTVDGVLEKHFGKPFGIINNEFIPRLCSASEDGTGRLILGSRYGLITVLPDELLVSQIPTSRVIFSQIRVDQEPVAIGQARSLDLSIGYGQSISFLFGLMPQSNSQQLEYRLGENEEWQLLEGVQLTFEHLQPGSYQLFVRIRTQQQQGSKIYNLDFNVGKPWYMNAWTIALFLSLTIILISLAFVWRSRLILRSNHKLKAQVALKTNQLRHQSRILLTNNQQLRKQLHVRHILFEQVLESISNNLRKIARRTLPDEQQKAEHFINAVQSELEILINVRSDNTGTKQVHDLAIVATSVINGWREEFNKSGIYIELVNNSPEKSAYVELTEFNLDIMFNALFASLLKRCYRNQQVMVTLDSDSEFSTLKVIDPGSALPQLESGVSVDHNDVSLTELPVWVENSGGTLRFYTYDERNIVEVTWPTATVSSELGLPAEEPRESVLDEGDPWLMKLEQLVQDNYANADFGTNSAAKLMYVSERSLQRRFKQAKDKTFKEYLNEVRLEQACRMLLKGDKVSNVAFECGFNDPSYFSQRFKHHFGMSPTQFVEESE